MTIGESYSACASVNPVLSAGMMTSPDSVEIGLGACILSKLQKPSISSGPGNASMPMIVLMPTIPL